MNLLDILLIALACVLLIPSIVLFVECMLALLPMPLKGPAAKTPTTRPRVTVLIPAHNEESVVESTLRSIMPQLRGHDRVLVIADNCNDQTAAVARACGAEVRERRNPDQRGKGYALDYGLCCVAENPPDVVVMVDADCLVHDRAIDMIAQRAMATNRPVQALYLMEKPERPTPRDLVSALAFLVKNLVRPTGLSRAGMPCLLTGSGMAFPWHVIRRTLLGSGNIVEDMQLGVDLVMEGEGPQFCPEARVTGCLPSGQKAARSQRRRWEHGHLRTLVSQAPRLTAEAFRRGRRDVLAVAMDLCVPPLSLLVMAWVTAVAVTVIVSITGHTTWTPALILLICGALIGSAIVATWFKFARGTLPLLSLLAAPLYVLWKIPMYLGFLLNPQRTWVRTDRDAVSRS